MRKIFVIALSLFILLSSNSLAEAAKKITPTPKKTTVKQKTVAPKKVIPTKKQSAKKPNTTKKSTSKQSTTKPTAIPITVSYKVTGGSLVISFSNLKNTSSVSYTLMYATNGQQEGAVGTIYPKGTNSASRTLLFGTCSKNVCRYHANISDVILEVRGKLTSGKTFSTSYSISL